MRTWATGSSSSFTGMKTMMLSLETQPNKGDDFGI
jgi:hypothetical protein